MTKQDYYNQNRLGFEGDIYLKQKFAEIIKQHKITWIIETGTYLGSTTAHLCSMCPRVDTVEVNEQHYKVAVDYLRDRKNVTLHLGNSPQVLATLIPPRSGKRSALFVFLDAHWGQYNPLLDELAVIATSKYKPVIAIHDFKVPNNPELEYDVYKDFRYEWQTIHASVDKIYGPGNYHVEYNTQATGAKRGVIFIYPK